MKTTKISESEIAATAVANLPTRPNAPQAFGGIGLTAAELKAAFDAMPIMIAERINSLIDDITAEHGSSVTNAIKTGLDAEHTLKDLFEDIKNGNFLTYLTAPSGTVAEYLLKLREDIDALTSFVGMTFEEEE